MCYIYNGDIVIRKIIKFIIVIFFMFSIFYFSSDNDTKSNKKSDGVVIGLCKVIMGDKYNENKKDYYINKYVFIVRKLAHFTIYFCLGCSLISFISEFMIINYKAILLALLICIIYAISDEVHQLFIGGRSGRILDVLIDSLGSFFGIYAYYIFTKLRRRLL